MCPSLVLGSRWSIIHAYNPITKSYTWASHLLVSKEICNVLIDVIFVYFLDVVWEIRRQGKNRYKSLTKSQCEAIETDHQRYEHERAIGKRTQARRHIQVESASSSNRKPIEVDYELERMLAPHEGRIRRQFQKGLWLQIRTSAHQRQIHAKINRIQIGNFISILFKEYAPNGSNVV